MNAQIRKYSNARAWFRGLLRNSVHAGASALLALFGTNGAEHLAPQLLSGISLNLKQSLAVFGSAAFLAALKFVSETTEDTETPFPVKPPPAP